jgi:hypothetical protein
VKRFVITLHYRVAPARTARLVRDVLADAWGPGHRSSIWGGDGLTVIVESRSADESDAVDLADAKVRALWPLVGAGSLTLEHIFPRPDLVRVGTRRGTSRRRALLRAVRAQAAQAARRGRWGPDDVPPSGRGHPDDDDGDDGTAGVREPRRPRFPPGHLSAVREEPRTEADRTG